MDDRTNTGKAPVPAADAVARTADTTMRDVTNRLDAEGYAGQVRVLEDARLECLTCRHVFPAKGRRADTLTRLEGSSDPSDLAVLVPMVCPHCHTGATLVAGYGPEATAEEAEVLRALTRYPHDDAAKPPTRT